MIATNSRYIADLVVRVQDANGNWHLAIYKGLPPTQKIQYQYYTWTQTDTIDSIAYFAYSDPSQWWIIADANPEIMYWDNLTPGTVIRIPLGAPTSG